MILKDKLSIQELINNSNNYFDDRIKFCVDRKKRTVAVDEEMHIDMEIELYDNGSDDHDIFGGDIVFEPEMHFTWESHPNIARNRELSIGRGRLLADETIISELMDIINEWIYKE